MYIFFHVFAFDLGHSFKFQPEVLFSQRSYEYTYAPHYFAYVAEEDGDPAYQTLDCWGYSTTFKDAVRYIEVPLLFKYVMNEGGKFSPVVFSGGYAAFRVSPREMGEPWDSMRTYSDGDAGFIVGAGFEMQRGNVKIHYDLRYNFGMVDVQKVKDFHYYDWCGTDLNTYYEYCYCRDEPVTRKNRSFSMMVGISF